MKRYHFLLIIMLFAGLAAAQSAGESAVAAAVEDLREAMLGADQAALAKLTAAELSYGHSDGRVEDQAAFLQSFAGGKSGFESLDFSDVRVRLAGKVAIVRHAFSAVTNNNGQQGTIKLAVLLVWQKHGKQWKLLARQAVRV